MRGVVVFPPRKCVLFFLLVSFENWLDYNLTNKEILSQVEDPHEKFVTISLWLWKWRNDHIFNNQVIPLDNKVHWLKNLVAEQASLAKASLKSNTLIGLSHVIQI